MTQEAFTAFHAGAWGDLGNYVYAHPRLGPVRGKVFLRKVLGLTGLEASLGLLPAGASVPFLHRHKKHEELYIFVKGRGQMQVDGTVIHVREGSVVRVSPGGARSWRAIEDLAYICIQAPEGMLQAGEIEDGDPLPDPVRWPS